LRPEGPNATSESKHTINPPGDTVRAPEEFSSVGEIPRPHGAALEDRGGQRVRLRDADHRRPDGRTLVEAQRRTVPLGEPHGGRPPAFDRDLYKARNVVERCSNRLKQFRAIATRFDELADRYRAGVHPAALIPWRHEPSEDRLSDNTWAADSGIAAAVRTGHVPAALSPSRHR
jgi:transposase